MSKLHLRIQPAHVAILALLGGLYCLKVSAATVQFFDDTQVATPVASAVTWDTINSNGYLFTYTRDKLFTGGGPNPIGRTVRVPWPQGVEAQAVTTPPPGVTDYKAQITLSRVDGDVFGLTAFAAMLLANTAGAGGSIEIMPSLYGEDGFNDPLYFDATGYYGQTFSYDETPNYLGSTAELKGFDTYKIGLYVDFALTALTLEGALIPGPTGDYNQNGVVDAADYVVWRKNDGAPDRYNTWRTNFGRSAGSASGGTASATVPEPAAVAQLVVTMIASLTSSLVSRRIKS